ncbi:MAG TPA: pentapeptide repeat-containing protein [Streptosporangiaceae bacterium]
MTIRWLAVTAAVILVGVAATVAVTRPGMLMAAALVIGVLVVASAVLTVLLGPVARQMARRGRREPSAKAIQDARQLLLQAAAVAAAVLTVPVVVVGLATNRADVQAAASAQPGSPGEQINMLSGQLTAAPSVDTRVRIIQQLMVLADQNPGTKSVSNVVLSVLIGFAVARSHQPRPPGQPPRDLYVALQAIGGADGSGAFADTPDMTKHLNGADLAGLNLAGFQFNWADLTSADLRGAELRGSGLSSAVVARASLEGADLADANLSQADLSGAQLQHADLRGAHLTGADFSDANLTDAILSCTELLQARDVPQKVAARCARKDL